MKKRARIIEDLDIGIIFEDDGNMTQEKLKHNHNIIHKMWKSPKASLSRESIIQKHREIASKLEKHTEIDDLDRL
jgi:hypothetical protein